VHRCTQAIFSNIVLGASPLGQYWKILLECSRCTLYQCSAVKGPPAIAMACREGWGDIQVTRHRAECILRADCILRAECILRAKYMFSKHCLLRAECMVRAECLLRAECILRAECMLRAECRFT
jgi:hypothetical protein